MPGGLEGIVLYTSLLKFVKDVWVRIWSILLIPVN